MHSALRETHKLPWDIYERALTWFFDTDEYQLWLDTNRTWQLRCIGAPGTGKTTLAALTLANLRDRFKGHDVAIASIFIQADVHNDQAVFVESFLISIFHQLSKKDKAVPDPANGLYDAYEVARRRGEKFSACIRLLRKALYTRIRSHWHVFLVVDDFDRCGAAVDLFLEDEFARLQRHGLKILVTSRMPFQRNTETVSCDAKDENGELCSNFNLSIYWQCKRCSSDWDPEADPREYYICDPCKVRGDSCKECGSSGHFFEPYMYIEKDLDLTDVLPEFVAWSLESEHGDLELGSDNDDMPPLSALGHALRAAPGTARSLMDKITVSGDGNITISRLRLDNIRTAKDVEAVFAVGDTLPKNLVALFDASMRRITAQAQHERELGVKAISAVASMFNGEPFEDLEKQLRRTLPRREGGLLPHYTLNEVLRATGGLLVVDCTQEQCLSPYHHLFFIYVKDNYNDSIFWDHADLRLAGPMRSKTLALPQVLDAGKKPPKGARKPLNIPRAKIVFGLDEKGQRNIDGRPVKPVRRGTLAV